MNHTTAILIRAKEMCEERWIGGGDPYQWSRICAGVALDRANDELNRSDHKARRIFCEVIGSTDVIGWNDTPGRTKEEVLRAFDMSIACSKAQEDLATV